MSQYYERDEAAAMKISVLKRLLQERGASTKDCVEKRDLVDRVIETNPPKPKAKTPPIATSTKRAAAPAPAESSTPTESTTQDRRGGGAEAAAQGNAPSRASAHGESSSKSSKSSSNAPGSAARSKGSAGGSESSKQRETGESGPPNQGTRAAGKGAGGSGEEGKDGGKRKTTDDIEKTVEESLAEFKPPPIEVNMDDFEYEAEKHGRRLREHTRALFSVRVNCLPARGSQFSEERPRPLPGPFQVVLQKRLDPRMSLHNEFIGFCQQRAEERHGRNWRNTMSDVQMRHCALIVFGAFPRLLEDGALRNVYEALVLEEPLAAPPSNVDSGRIQELIVLLSSDQKDRKLFMERLEEFALYCSAPQYKRECFRLGGAGLLFSLSLELEVWEREREVAMLSLAELCQCRECALELLDGMEVPQKVVAEIQRLATTEGEIPARLVLFLNVATELFRHCMYAEHVVHLEGIVSEVLMLLRDDYAPYPLRKSSIALRFPIAASALNLVHVMAQMQETRALLLENGVTKALHELRKDTQSVIVGNAVMEELLVVEQQKDAPAVPLPHSVVRQSGGGVERDSGGAVVELCAWCGTMRGRQLRLRRCGGCKVTSYCSERCQRKHWKHSHARECRAPGDA